MVRSDGNGSYVVDKNLWKGLIALVLILLSITGLWGQSILTTIDNIGEDLRDNQIKDAGQGEEIRGLTKQLDRIESKLDALIKQQ